MAARPKPKAKAPRKKKAPATRAEPAEHRIAIVGVALSVAYAKTRSERFELRGTAMLNTSAPAAMVRTTGLAVLTAGKGGKNALAYDPASLNRNLTLTLTVSADDLALFRDIFVTGTGSEAGDPALVIWATTARAVRPDASDTVPVTAFGYHLDFAPEPTALR